jgi:hypothetical protein
MVNTSYSLVMSIYTASTYLYNTFYTNSIFLFCLITTHIDLTFRVGELCEVAFSMSERKDLLWYMTSLINGPKIVGLLFCRSHELIGRVTITLTCRECFVGPIINLPPSFWLGGDRTQKAAHHHGHRSHRRLQLLKAVQVTINGLRLDTRDGRD